MSKIKTFFIICCIILISASIAWYLIDSKPVSVKKKPTIVSPLVQVRILGREDAEVYIEALGTVEASQKTMVRARVSGQVKTLGENSDVGKTLKAGELLAEIDDAMYLSMLASKESSLLQAMAAYDLEMGQQNVAKAEVAQLKNLSNVLDNVSRNRNQVTDLALRKPQLQQAKAGVDAAKAAVDLAKLDVSYTTITAPYNALVINRNVSLGSQAGASDALFEIVGTDEYRIRAAVPLDKISALDLDEGNKNVKITSSTGIERAGFVEHSIASLDTETRMGRVLVSIPDPLGLQNQEPTIILGDQVVVNLSLGTFKNVFAIPRNALYSGDNVFIAVKKEANREAQTTENNTESNNDESKAPKTNKTNNSTGSGDNVKGKRNSQNLNDELYVLDIRPVKVAYKDINYAYVISGINSGEYLITSILPAPINNMTIRIDEILE